MLSILVSITLLFGGAIPRPDDSAGLREAAFAAFQTGQYLRAEELSRTALASAQLSNNECDIARSYSALGDALQVQKRLAEAERNYEKAISLFGHQRERARDAAMVWRHLAAGLTAEARYREALAALKEASTLVAKNKLEDPELNAQVLNNLGFIYYNQGKRDKAEKLFLQASEIQFTPSNLLEVDQWQIVNNLGRLYQASKKYAKAEAFYWRALQLAEARRGPSHPALSAVLDNLGMLHTRTGRYQDAELQLQRSLAILEHSKVSFDAIFMMRTLYGLGQTYRAQNDAVRAEELMARAAEIARKLVRPSEMPEVLEILDTYAKVLNDLSHSAEAQQLEKEAQRIRATMAYTVPLENAN